MKKDNKIGGIFSATHCVLAFLAMEKSSECQEVIFGVDSRIREKTVQRVIHGQFFSYLVANQMDMSYEPDERHGQASFYGFQ